MPAGLPTGRMQRCRRSCTGRSRYGHRVHGSAIRRNRKSGLVRRNADRGGRQGTSIRNETASTTHPRVRKASLVLLSGDFATRGQLDRYCQEQGVKPHIAIEANSVSGIIEIVQHSDRLATVLPGALAHRHEGLCPVRLREAMPQLSPYTRFHRQSRGRNAPHQEHIRQWIACPSLWPGEARVCGVLSWAAWCNGDI
jgi:DNA-binding transcriptional LysR family regulator